MCPPVYKSIFLALEKSVNCKFLDYKIVNCTDPLQSLPKLLILLSDIRLPTDWAAFSDQSWSLALISDLPVSFVFLGITGTRPAFFWLPSSPAPVKNLDYNFFIQTKNNTFNKLSFLNYKLLGPKILLKRFFWKTIYICTYIFDNGSHSIHQVFLFTEMMLKNICFVWPQNMNSFVAVAISGASTVCFWSFMAIHLRRGFQKISCVSFWSGLSIFSKIKTHKILWELENYSDVQLKNKNLFMQ